MAKRVRLTKKLIDGLMPTDKVQRIWDSECLGFHIRVEVSGRKKFCLRYSVCSDRMIERQIQIGKVGGITVEQVRGIARQWLGKVAAGEDPYLDRIKPKTRHMEDGKAWGRTLKQVADRYIGDRLHPRKPVQACRDRPLT